MKPFKTRCASGNCSGHWHTENEKVLWPTLFVSRFVSVKEQPRLLLDGYNASQSRANDRIPTVIGPAWLFRLKKIANLIMVTAFSPYALRIGQLDGAIHLAVNESEVALPTVLLVELNITLFLCVNEVLIPGTH